jgi:hypothetical protein
VQTEITYSLRFLRLPPRTEINFLSAVKSSDSTLNAEF